MKTDKNAKPDAQGAKPPTKGQPGSGKPEPPAATPGATPALPYQPGVSPNAVDVIGIVPEDVHVDPDITEGHPGYDESGPSEMHPPKPRGD